MSTLMRMRHRLSALFLLISVLGTTGMSVSLQGTPGALSINPTMNSVGLVTTFSGADDNFARIWYRPEGNSDWLNGAELVADRYSDEWRGSLVSLLPDTAYELQVQFIDPHGVTLATLSGSTRTLPDYPNVGSGGTIRTVPDQGSLQSVIKAAAPGDTVRIRGGVYHTSAELGSGDSGQPGRYITIEAVPGEQVILDGSDPALNNANVDNWLLYQDNIYYTDLSWGSRSCSSRSLPNYVGEQQGDKDVRYLFYKSTVEWADFLAGPRGKAFYDCDGSNPGRLYVVTYEGLDPDTLEMHVSKEESGLILTGTDYFRIRNLEFRYYALFGVHLRNPGADYNIVEGNSFHNIGRYHIRLGNGSLPLMGSYNLIQDNNFHETGYRDSRWTWDQQKNFAEGAAIFLNYAGPGNVIRRNTIERMHDGMTVGRQSSETDVYENVVRGCMDDGIQIDAQPGYNIRLWRNRFEDCYSGVSTQDWFQGNFWNAGPVYVFRNLIEGGPDPQGRTDINGNFNGYETLVAFKVGGSQQGYGRLYLYHNTIVIENPRGAGNGVQDSGGQFFSGIVSRNNLWRIQNRVFSFRDPGTIVEHNFDCDNIYHLNSSGELIRWAGNDYANLAQFRQATGHELYGLSNQATHFSVDFQLAGDSPEVDAGCLIDGFSEGVSLDYIGLKPDIGAFEFSP